MSDPISFSEAELLALLRDRTVSSASIAAEMEATGATPHPVEALDATRRIFDAFDASLAEALPQLPEPLVILALDAAADARASEFVGAASALKDKAVQKAAKRAIHKLRTQGLKVDAPKAQAPAPAPQPAPTDEFPPLVSIPDGHGERLVFFPCPQRTGLDVVQLVLSDRFGVVSASVATLPRREWRKFLQKLTSGRNALLADVPRAYARGLVARALDQNAVARRAVPTGYAEAAFLLGPAVTAKPSPGRDLPAPENEEQLRARAADLFALKELQGWLPDDELVRRIDKLTASGDDDARRALVADEASRYWTSATRRLWAERLFDAAWIFDASDRADDARLSLASARALDADGPLEAVPFAVALFDRLAQRPDSTGPARLL